MFIYGLLTQTVLSVEISMIIFVNLFFGKLTVRVEKNLCKQNVEIMVNMTEKLDNFICC